MRTETEYAQKWQDEMEDVRGERDDELLHTMVQVIIVMAISIACWLPCIVWHLRGIHHGLADLTANTNVVEHVQEISR